MQLDERSIMVLEELLLFPGVKINHLTAKFKLSRSQVIYTIDKINDWLKENYYPVIQNDREIGLVIDPSVREKFPGLVTNASKTEYIPSVRERTYFIVILLLSRQEELSLFHISDQLKVSRNTVLTDLKKLGEYVGSYNLVLRYTRQDGYFLTGKEFDKRKLLIELIPQILKLPNGFQSLLDVTGISNEEVLEFRARFESIEEELMTRFTDEKLDELPFVFLLLKRRINYGKKVIFDHLSYKDLTKTKEYHIVQKFVPTITQTDDERLYITLQLLSLSIFNFSLVKTEDGALRNAIDATLNHFEKLACLSFEKYEELSEKLYQHMKPASYRIKYKLDLKNPLLEGIKKEYGSVHHLVKQSIKPIEELLQTEISEDEVSFITILVMSWLQDQEKNINKRPKAIVICPNGISVSRLLLGTLKEMFPAIQLVENMSVREFYKYKEPHDIVFSTVLLDTTKKLFLIKSFISEADKHNLKIRVNQEVFGFTPDLIDLSSLIKVIKKHGSIENEALLLRDIKKFFGQSIKKHSGDPEAYELPNLKTLLTPERVIFKSKVLTVEEAVRSAAAPLIEANAIEPRYVDAILKIMDENEPYMFIAPGVAIPHASPEDGVKLMGMSMMRLDEAVDIAPGFPVKVFIVLAAVDRKQHLKALAQLNELVAQEENVKQLVDARSRNEIIRLVEKYSVDEDFKEVVEN